MITLYHCVSARSFRPLWTLEELGVAYELKMLPFPPRVRSRSFLEVNPLGTVPAFFDGDSRMTESAAICQYLATKYGPSPLEVLPAEQDFGAYLNWLHFGEATLTFPQTIVLRYGRFEAPERRLPQAAEDYQKWFLARLRAIDATLVERPWLCAKRFTAADISVGYALMLGEHLGLASKFPVAVRDYFERLRNLESFQRALQAEQWAAIAQGVDPTPAPLCGN